MTAFVPTTGLSVISGATVTNLQFRTATDGLRRNNAVRTRTTKMVAYPYTGSGYGNVGIPYSGAVKGEGFGLTSTMDVVDTAAEVSIFKTLVSLLQETGLDYELKKGGPFTVFAPTDSAFASLLEPHGFKVLAPLLRPENREELKKVLAYHVIKGNISSTAIVANGKMVGETLAGVPLTVMGYGKKVTAGSAPVVKADIPCTNGVIHVISSLLIPSSFTPQPAGPVRPKFAASSILDVYANTITPRQALGIDPLPTGSPGGALTK